MSDHFSGPRAIAGPAGDITDLYAFPSPERPGHLYSFWTCCQTPPPTRTSRTRSSTASGYGRSPSKASGQTTAFPFAGEDQELVFSSHFEAPRQGGAGVAPVQEGWCVAPSGEKTRLRVNDEQGASSDGLRVYAGLRAEPFFIDVPALAESQKNGRLAFKEVGTNSAMGANVLSIVVEADCRPWLHQRPRATVCGGWRDGGRRQAPDPHRALRPPRDQERYVADEAV